MEPNGAQMELTWSPVELKLSSGGAQLDHSCSPAHPFARPAVGRSTPCPSVCLSACLWSVCRPPAFTSLSNLSLSLSCSCSLSLLCSLSLCLSLSLSLSLSRSLSLSLCLSLSLSLSVSLCLYVFLTNYRLQRSRCILKASAHISCSAPDERQRGLVFSSNP